VCHESLAVWVVLVLSEVTNRKALCRSMDEEGINNVSCFFLNHYSPDMTRVRLTRFSFSAVDEHINVVCMTGNFAYVCRL
jgi:hypothetical protein